MAKYIYPAVFTQGENGFYYVRFPDISGCITTGKDLQDALDMAKDVLCLMLYELEQNGAEIPAASAVNGIPCGSDGFASLIDCDTDWYRRFYESKPVKKTLTIPAWLNEMAERNALDLSQILQDALKAKLHIDF